MRNWDLCMTVKMLTLKINQTNYSTDKIYEIGSHNFIYRKKYATLSPT